MYNIPSTFRVTHIQETDDSTFTFRVSSKLKEDFSRICKNEQLSSATALKRYMASCIKNNKIK